MIRTTPSQTAHRAARRATAALAAGCLLASTLAAGADGVGNPAPTLAIGGFSSQATASSARIGAQVIASSAAAGGAGSGASRSGSPAGGAATSAPPALTPPPPTLPTDSPLLAEAQPAGPGSFWYESPAGECIYAPSTSPNCYELVAPAAPAIDVDATAASLASELDLSLAPVEASPAAADDGLTGATSWFWLATAPGARQLSLSLDGETVSVSAQPGAVAWSFGDGGTLLGGPGVPFVDGAPPPDAVTHVYETRCLPGDAGSDPYVLPGCGPSGYPVVATVEWSVAFSASGPIAASGTLTARETTSELDYPVSEVRAFLEGAGG